MGVGGLAEGLAVLAYLGSLWIRSGRDTVLNSTV